MFYLKWTRPFSGIFVNSKGFKQLDHITISKRRKSILIWKLTVFYGIWMFINMPILNTFENVRGQAIFRKADIFV